ncbi:hypothetical protein LTR27_005979 [Elasticomyces elasticus]|nr:hypothetical protein LTR27_005979 [Elasticomyces elasticus]
MTMMRSNVYRTRAALALTLLAADISHAAFDLGYGSDADLTSFVTRPEIKAPRYNITREASVDSTPGFWFVAPYVGIFQDVPPDQYYLPCSTGPHIYDNDGELIWSSACKTRNQNACDFRRFLDQDGNEHLSALFIGYEDEYRSTAAIMNSSYDIVTTFDSPALEGRINMHELNIVDEGRSAVYLTSKGEARDISELGLSNQTTGWVSNIGLREVNLASGRTNFEWWSKGVVSILESTIPPNFVELSGQGWNWLHPNSVDKDDAGEYLISGRFTDTIYKISSTGQIIWRLGGKQSSFHLQDFSFSKQHDARFLSKHGSIEVISLFDNAAVSHPGVDLAPTFPHSSAIVIEIDHDTGTARVIKRIARPDGGLTKLRGNFQILSNGNAFVSWADNGYISEHNVNGDLLFEAQFASKRFVTYRTYKFNFTGHPTEPPIMKAFVYGEVPETSTTVWYASWNGATDIAKWHFYRQLNSTAGYSFVGAARKDGFETMFMSDGFECVVYAEAVASNGTVLGRTDFDHPPPPAHWAFTVDTHIHQVAAKGLLPVLQPFQEKDEL